MADTSPDLARLEPEVACEIEAVHDFISAWFRGDTPAEDDDFETGLAARLAPQLINVQPAGQILTRDELLTAIRKGHGINPAFGIEIRDVRIHGCFEDGNLVLASYTELQTGALNTNPSDNGRISTVLLQRKPGTDGFTWLHIHETATDTPAGSETI